MLKIVKVREYRPIELVRRASKLAGEVLKNPALFPALVDIFAQCRDNLRNIDDVLEEVVQVDEETLQIFRAQLVDYFGYSDSPWGFGNRRGLLFEEVINAAGAEQLKLINETVLCKVRDADFHNAEGIRISSLDKNLDFAFKGQTTTSVVECKIGLKNWMLQSGKFTSRGTDKLDYMGHIYEHCCKHIYALDIYFCCLDSPRDLAQARQAIRENYSYIKVIDGIHVARAIAK